jgi:hypothetical protein
VSHFTLPPVPPSDSTIDSQDKRTKRGCQLHDYGECKGAALRQLTDSFAEFVARNRKIVTPALTAERDRLGMRSDAWRRMTPMRRSSVA